jgi:hypothetical protein
MPLAQRALAVPEDALGPDHPGARTMAGFGDPVFDAAEEAKALAERREWARIDAARAKGGLHGTRIDRAKLHQDRVLYFATECRIAADVAGFGEPSLVPSLAKQQTERDEGRLRASQVAQLKLSADWVVLPACNTVAADKPGGGTPSRLARAVFYAGAGALLLSRWSVNSEVATRLAVSTPSIMKTDPKRRRAGAIRNAMLAYVDGKGSTLNASGGHFPSSERSDAMSNRVDMRRTLRRCWFAMLFGVAASLMVSPNAAPVRAADLALPTDEKILEALKAKRLTRCPRASARPRCGGAQLQNRPLKSRVLMSTTSDNANHDSY